MSENGYRVGVVGATGAVGSTILEVLSEREFPASEVVPFASERSAGKRLDLDGRELECRPLSPEAIEGLDLVLSSAGGSVSAEWASATPAVRRSAAPAPGLRGGGVRAGGVAGGPSALLSWGLEYSHIHA